MTLTTSFQYWLVDFWAEHGDYRSSDYLMIRHGLLLPLGILLIYFFFVTQIGPRLMAKRPPFSLKWTLLVYNVFMVALNLHFFIETLRNFNYGLDIFDFAYPTLDDTSELTLKKVWMCHNYLLSKFFDLFDTIFFVLRKKQSQVTKTHLYHHTSVCLMGFIAVRFVPTNNPLAIFAICNTFLHTLMYSYYALGNFWYEIFGKKNKKSCCLKIIMLKQKQNSFSQQLFCSIIKINFFCLFYFLFFISCTRSLCTTLLMVENIRH